MEKIVDLVSTGAQASDIVQSIKDALYDKASSNIENMRSNVASSMFDQPEEETEEESE
jgi:hypothetical protein|tara:strand:+ start:377 stop:550 length:174 start_codon:yes stop_codon:yes gene_type:complete